MTIYATRIHNYKPDDDALLVMHPIDDGDVLTWNATNSAAQGKKIDDLIKASMSKGRTKRLWWASLK